MSEGGVWHVSSAIVSVRPDLAEAVVRRIEAMAGTEIRGRNDRSIVVVMEGRSVGELGDRLSRSAASTASSPPTWCSSTSRKRRTE